MWWALGIVLLLTVIAALLALSCNALWCIYEELVERPIPFIPAPGAPARRRPEVRHGRLIRDRPPHE